jgi:DedD protein
MDEQLKQRLVGAAVLVIAAIVFVPMLLEGEPDMEPAVVSEVPVSPAREVTGTGTASVEPSPPPRAPQPTAMVEESPKTPASRGSAGGTPSPDTGSGTTTTSGFAVQLGTFSKAANATALRDRLAARGYAAFVKTEGSGSGAVSRVYVGPQKNRAAAEKELKKLLGETKLRGFVVNYPG